VVFYNPPSYSQHPQKGTIATPLTKDVQHRQEDVTMTIYRIAEVKRELGYRSHASIYQALRAGLFTKPVNIGTRSVGWPESEVKAIAAARIADCTEQELKALVKQLHQKRREHFNLLMADPEPVKPPPARLGIVGVSA
jgi:prophage regulatory protein